MKNRVLVTGANGYVGNALILSLLEKKSDFIVRASARRGSVLKSKELEVFKVGNLEDNPDYSKAFEGCDTVVDCAAMVSPRRNQGWIDQSAFRRVNVIGTAYMARQAHLAGVKRFIFLSSTQANGETTPPYKKFFPNSLPRPKLAFGISMLDAEKELKKIAKETGMEVVIVRIPTVYGPECKGLVGVIRTMVRYCLPLPLRWANKNQRSLVAIDNLTDFLSLCIKNPKAANQLFFVSDGKDLSTLEIFKLFARTGSRPCCLWGFPVALLKLFNSYIGRQSWEDFFFGSMVVDTQKEKMELNWTPPVPIEECFRRAWGKRKVLGGNL
ncbi:MAG: NAD-dependent epimerase/dehydratase family protein [Burkholderiaceae bacterium]|nr:NAD-dependent epimerase/dehydratase family protein [Burkholderiaceae bacterium]